MASDTAQTNNGTAHLLVGAFNATGDALTPMNDGGEVAMATASYPGGNNGYVRSPSGHKRGKGSTNAGTVAGLSTELDLFSLEDLALLMSAFTISQNGNLLVRTTTREIETISAVIIPSSALDEDGAVADFSQVQWFPFLTDENELQRAYKVARGDNSNSPVAITLTGLDEKVYAGTPLPTGVANGFTGDPKLEGLSWKLPAPYEAAA